jgi:hypothetical protein
MNDALKPRRSVAPWIIAIIIILALVIGWHFIFPLLGLTIALTGAVWGVIVGTITVLCIAIILFFIFTGVGIFILGLLAFIWGLVAIILFPIIFPIVIPLLIILLFISFLMRRRRD